MERQTSFETGLLLTVVSWAVPGLGFVVKRDFWRGAAIFLLINGTFWIGLLLHGTVLVPEFRYYSPTFNVVSLLTFIGQLGNGGASLFCLIHDKFNWGLYHWNEKDALFDLATLYLLVSGCMNYFAACGFYDRHVRRHPDDAPAEEKS